MDPLHRPSQLTTARARFPVALPGGVLQIRNTTTYAADAAAKGAFEVRLVEPDGEEIRFPRQIYDHSRGWGEITDTDTFSLLELFPGPVVAHVVFIDADSETMMAEARGWIGPQDAPVLVLNAITADTATTTVGKRVTAIVTVANRGQT